MASSPRGQCALTKVKENLKSEWLVSQDKLFVVRPKQIMNYTFYFLENHSIVTCNQTKPAKCCSVCLCLSVCDSVFPLVCPVLFLFFFHLFGKKVDFTFFRSASHTCKNEDVVFPLQVVVSLLSPRVFSMQLHQIALWNISPL